MEIIRDYYIDETNPVNGTYKCCMKQEFHGGINRKYGKMTLRAAENGRLSGTMFPTMFWLDASFSYGSCDRENFAFTVFWSTPCQQYSMDVSGKVKGDHVTASVHSPMGDYVLEGERISS